MQTFYYSLFSIVSFIAIVTTHCLSFQRMDHRVLVFKTHAKREISKPFCDSVTSQLSEICKKCRLATSLGHPLYNKPPSFIVIGGQNTEGVINVDSLSSAPSHPYLSPLSLSEKLHSALDSLPSPSPATCITTFLWLSDIPPDGFPVSLYGSLSRGVSWHKAGLTILSEEASADSPPPWLRDLRGELCPCLSSLGEHLAPLTHTAWRGDLAFYQEDEDSGPSLASVPGFQLQADFEPLQLLLRQLETQREESDDGKPLTPGKYYSSRLELVSEVCVHAIPPQLMTGHRLRLTTPLLETGEGEGDLRRHLMEELFPSYASGQGLIFKLKYSTDQPRYSEKMSTEEWKSQVVNCNFQPTPPCADLGFNVGSLTMVLTQDPLEEEYCSRPISTKTGFLLKSVSDSKSSGLLRQAMLKGPPKTTEEHLTEFKDLVEGLDLPKFWIDHRKLLELQRYIKKVQATVITGLFEQESEFLKNNSIEDVLRAIQDKLLEDTGISYFRQPLTGEHIDEIIESARRINMIPKDVAPGDWQEKRFLRFLDLHSKQSENKSLSKILQPSETDYVILEAAQLLKHFTKQGEALQQLEIVEAKNKNCPMRPQKNKEDYEKLLADNFDKIDIDFKGFKFKGDNFSKLEFTQYHDVYYNTGDKAEAYDKDCKDKRDHYVGITRETSSTFSVDAEPDKFKVNGAAKKDSQPNSRTEIISKKKKENIPPSKHQVPLRKSPRKQVREGVKVLGAAQHPPPQVAPQGQHTLPEKRKSGGADRKTTGAQQDTSDISDINRKKLRGAVYETLMRKGLDEKHALFKPSFVKLFNICKVYVMDAQSDPRTCTKAFMLEICECNVDNVIKMEKIMAKQRAKK